TVKAHARIDALFRDLEEHTPELVVDLLVVLVLRLAAEPPEHRAEPDLLEEVRVSEREVQRDHEDDVTVLVLDLDTGLLEPLELPLREGGRRRPRLELAVDHAVSPVAHHGELVRERRVDGRVVALVRGEPDAEGREELRVRDVLLLGSDDAPR